MNKIAKANHGKPRKRIIFMPQYGINSPGGRYRIYQYLDDLEEKFDVKILPAQEKAYFREYFLLKVIIILILTTFNRIRHLFIIKKGDIVVFQRDVYQFSVFPIFEWLISRKIKIVFDFDDSIWINNKYIPKILKMSSSVIAGNSFLEKYARKYNKDVIKIPTSIDMKRYKLKRYKKNKTIILGWIGTPNNLIYLQDLRDVFDRLEKEYDIAIKIISAKQNLDLGKIKIIQKEWNLTDEVDDLQSIDIGLMPLRQDEWSEGKCGCKLLQYMGVGVVGVASPVGVNKEIIKEGKNGFLCNTKDEWFDKLSLLIKDFKLRKKLGIEGRKNVKKEYSVESNVKKLVQLLERL